MFVKSEAPVKKHLTWGLGVSLAHCNLAMRFMDADQAAYMRLWVTA